MANTLDYYIKEAQSHFNRREYEHFILPIIKVMEKNVTQGSVLNLREPLLKFIANCEARIDADVNQLGDGTLYIEVERMKEILNEEKSLLI